MASWRTKSRVALLAALAYVWPLQALAGAPPEQKLPSALLVFPFIEASGLRDTRVQLVNLTGDPQLLQCFYVESSICSEVGFQVFLTPYQPLSWLISSGLNDVTSGSAVPPFFGEGELKCVVVPPREELQFHNTIQGRATIYGSDGATVSLGAVGFRRFTDGEFTGVVNLDGITYAQCPDKLHFDVLTEQAGAGGEMILVPCKQDLLLQLPTSIQVQFLVINEFEQTFSASMNVTCFSRRALGDISSALTRSVAATDTAHVVVRGVGGPLLGLVIDEVSLISGSGTAGNEPSFQGGRSATVIFP